jgi:ATP-binding cassette subfamily B protein
MLALLNKLTPKYKFITNKPRGGGRGMDIAQKSFKYYWKHIRKFPKLVVPIVFILPVNSLVNNYLPPLILAAIINRLSRHEYLAHHVWSSFGTDLILYLILSLVGTAVLWRIFDLMYWRLEGKVKRSIEQEVFDHLVSQSADFHANQFSGSLVSSTSKLGNSYVRIADTTMFQVAPLFIGLIFVSAVMAFRSILYTALLLGFSLIYITASFFVTKKVRLRGAELALAESKQTGVLADALTNIMAIKSFAHERGESRHFKNITDDTYSKLMAMMSAFQRQQVSLGILTGILAASSLFVAVVSVVSFGANLATAFLIFNYTNSISSQLFQFSNNALRNYNRSFGDSVEMIDILATSPEVIDAKETETSHIKNGVIDFDEVVFTHTDNDDAIFNGLDLHIDKGEKIGLVGHSGSGKTTLTRLLLRFSDIDSGAITIDGQNIANISQNDLHKSIAYVPQEPLLFHRSISENIAYGKDNTSEASIIKAAKLSHSADFISNLPKGYDTLVGERGVKLSGGQRQRIAIARAMLKDSPILVLDEATSALDSESEVLIQDALWSLMKGRTAIVIAHRLSTIQKMDRIIVLEDGSIAEIGNHNQLLKRKGIYAKLWAHQSGGFMQED